MASIWDEYKKKNKVNERISDLAKAEEEARRYQSREKQMKEKGEAERAVANAAAPLASMFGRDIGQTAEARQSDRLRDFYLRQASDALRNGNKALWNDAITKSRTVRADQIRTQSAQEAQREAQYQQYLEKVKAVSPVQYAAETASEQYLKAGAAKARRLALEAGQREDEAYQIYRNAPTAEAYTQAEFDYDFAGKQRQKAEVAAYSYEKALEMQRNTKTAETMQKLVEDTRAQENFSDKVRRGQSLFQQSNQLARAGARHDAVWQQETNLEDYSRAYQNALEGQTGYVADLEAGWMSPEDDETYYAIFADSPAKAAEFAAFAQKQGYQQHLDELREWAEQNYWTRKLAFLGGTLGSLASGLAPFSEGGQQLSEESRALLAGGAESLQENGLWGTGFLAGQLDENIPIIGGKGLGDLYQLGSSMLQSGMIAGVSALSGDAAGLVSALGTMLMGSSAAATDYAECLARGMDESTARTHAVWAGIAEAGFEYLSIDKLVNQDFAAGALKTAFQQAGIEMSEEAATTIANRLTDAAISRKNGYDNSVETRAKELAAMGLDYSEAIQKAEQEWTTELLNDALGGFISGGLMTGGNYLTGFAKGQAVRARENAALTQGVRSIGQSMSADELSALEAYAKANQITWDENAASYARQQAQAAEATEGQAKAGSRSERAGALSVGVAQQQIAKQIKTQMQETELAGLNAAVDQLAQTYGEGIRKTAGAAVYDTLRERLAGKSVNEIASVREQVRGIQNEELRQDAMQAVNDVTAALVRQTNDTATVDRALQQLASEGRRNGALDLRATVKEGGQTREATIQGIDKDGRRVILSDGTRANLETVEADADTKDVLQKIASYGLGSMANDVFAEYQARIQRGDRVNGYTFLSEYASALDQGRQGAISVEEAIARNSLDAQTVRDAYERGRNAARDAARSAQALRNASRVNKTGTTGRKGSVDVSKIKGEILTTKQRRQMELVRQVAEALGIDVEWFASSTKNGRYVGENGSYKDGKIRLDINAGRNLISETLSGIVATFGHELTHWLQDFSPALYQEYKELVLQELTRQIGTAGVERLIYQQQRKSRNKLDRAAAEDEVVADASQKMLLNSEFMQTVAEENPTLAQKIVGFIRSLFQRLKEIFAESTGFTEEAKLIDEAEQRFREAAGELYARMMTDAAAAAAESDGQQKTAQDGGKQFSERDSDYLAAVERGDMETAKRMVDEAAKAGGWTIHAYHGTGRADRVGTVFRPDRATSGPMAYFTDSKEIADHYAKDKKDTSLAYDPDYDSYETQFRVKTQKGAKYPFNYKIASAWGYIDIAKRNEIREKAGQLRYDWDGEDDNAFILAPGNREANGGFQWQLKEAKGNVIKALIEQWLNGGNLFNEEGRFLDVLKMVGITDELKRVGLDVEYKDPLYREEKTYDVFLKIKRPFVTSKVNNRFIENFLKWADKQPYGKYETESQSADLWDKNNVTAEDFAERLRDDMANDYTHAWTSIPDVVSDYLKHLGYDGIQDQGGKFHEEKHTVYIPFSSEQVKSTDPVTYDDQGKPIPLSERFNPENEDIRYSERDPWTISDVDILTQTDESAAANEEQRRLLREAKAKEQQIRALEAKLAEARAQLQTTDRSYNTRGITARTKEIMRYLGMGDANQRGIVQTVSELLRKTYDETINLVDEGKSSAAMDRLYEGAREAAEAMMEDGTYTEKHGYGWVKAKWAQVFAVEEEARQHALDDIITAIVTDFSTERWRPQVQKTAADRIVERTEAKYKPKLEATQAENARLTAENERLQRENEFAKKLNGNIAQEELRLKEQLHKANQDVKEAKRIGDKNVAKLTAKADRLADTLKKTRDAQRKAETALQKTSHQLWLTDVNRKAAEYGTKVRDIDIQRQKTEISALERKLAKQKAVLEGKMLTPELRTLINIERGKAEAKVKAQKDEVFKNYKERKAATELRGRIANLKEELQKRMLNPSDRTYVPAFLAETMADVLDTIDNSPREGTQAAAKHQSVAEAVRAMAAAYNDLKTNQDAGWEYASEYDEKLHREMNELAKTVSGRKLAELTLDELQSVYDTIKQIRDTLRQATKLLNREGSHSIYEAIDSIVRQQEGMKAYNEVGKAEQRKRLRLLDNLSVMRAVEMMSGWDRNAALYQMVQGVEQGTVARDAWLMGYDKTMRQLKTGKNEKAYRDALTKKQRFAGVEMTKLQALQIYMTWQREANNDKLVHLQKGGATIRDALAVMDGKADKAVSRNVDVTPELIRAIEDSLTQWDRDYTKTVRDYFKEETKAVNEVYYKLKKRLLTSEDYYVPVKVDKSYLDAKVDESNYSNLFVKTPGFLPPLETSAPQPVIIDGMETLMKQHVKETADYIGLALPIRDFAKVFNGRLRGEEGKVYTSLKRTLQDNFGEKGTHLLLQSMIDVQGGNQRQSWSSHIAENLNKLQSAFVKTALLVNPSVTIKQAASYIAAESVLSHAALVKGNRAVLAGEDASHAPGLIAHLFFNSEGKTAQRIYDEIDRHTSMHYTRRLGMSQAELANEALRSGKLKRAVNNAGAALEQTSAGHTLRKAGEWLNPVTWIQRMDVATTAALWVACKEQAKMDGQTFGTAEYWQRVTELYERVLRETQPMYDDLHRTANQKSQGSLMQMLFPFRTVPIQNHGQIASAYEALKAAKGKSESVRREAAKHFSKTVWANTESAVIFALMTFLAAAMKRKTKKYRDEDEELTMESVLFGIGKDTLATWFSNLFPVYGSEVLSVAERAYGKFTGTGGYSFDAFSVGAVDMLNDLATAFDKTFADVGKLMRGEDVSLEDFRGHLVSAMLKGAKIAGIPAETVKTYAAGLIQNVKDILAGRIPALNDESWERSASVNASRLLKAWTAGDMEKVEAVEQEMLRNYESAGKDEGEANDALKTRLTATAKQAVQDGNLNEQDAAAFLEDSGFYDAEDARKKARFWALQTGDPAAEDATESQANRFYDGSAKTQENGTSSASAAGMSFAEYQEAMDVLSNVSGEDADGDGNIDAGSREAAYIAAIDAMDLTPAQKDALYFAEYKQKEKISLPWR